MLEVSRKDPPALAAFELLRDLTPLRPFRGMVRGESLGRQLLVYRAGLVVPVDEIESFVVEGYGLLTALLRAARPAKSESTVPAV